MPYPESIKSGNIKENWLFQLGYSNGGAQGGGEGAFSPINQNNGNPNLINNPSNITKTQTDIDVDDGTVFIAGDFIKVGSEIMQIVSISTNELTVLRGAMGSSATTHNDNTQLFWNNFLPISFSDETYEERFYYGVITNNPSIRESIDLTKGTAKTSNISLSVPDFTCKGDNFSKEIFGGTRVYINQEVRVFAKINGETPNRIQTFRLADIKFNGDTLSLSLVTARPWDFITIPQAKTDKNNYFPVVYGLYVPNDSVTGSEDYCPSLKLYPCPVERSGSTYIRALQPQSLDGSSGKEGRLHFYEKDMDLFVPITKSDNSYRNTAVTTGNGHSTVADIDLKRGFKTKGLKEEATSNSLFSDGSLAVDFPYESKTSGTNSTAEVVVTNSTTNGTSSKSLFLECPNVTGTVTAGFSRFHFKHTGTIAVDNLQLTGSTTVKGLSTNTTFNTINYATEVEPGSPEIDTLLSSQESLTISDGKLPANYGVILTVNANALDGVFSVNADCDVFDARLKINAKLNFPEDKSIAEGTKFFYCGAEGLTRSWSSGSCAEIHEAHLDLLIRFAGLTQENGSAISDPTSDSQVYKWGALDTSRSGWDLRYWTYKEVSLLKILEKMAYEGGFVFRYRYDGTPQYIHIANSPSTDHILSKFDISNINVASMPLSEIVSKRNIEFEKHPAENRYISTLTTEDTSNNIRKKFNIKEKENIEDIKLDMLVANVGTVDCGSGNPNDSFANYYANITGDIKLLVTCDIVNPAFYDMEVGDVIEFDENNMFPETPMGHNSATWNNLQMMVTSINRSVGKLSINAREI